MCVGWLKGIWISQVKDDDFALSKAAVRLRKCKKTFSD
jgi:hypothetical protein